MPGTSAWGVESEPKDPSVDGMPGFCLASFNNMVPLRPWVLGCWGVGTDRVQFGTTNSGVSPRPLTVILSKQLGPGFQNFDLLSVQICKGYLRQSWLPLRLPLCLHTQGVPSLSAPSSALSQPNKAWNVCPKLQLAPTFSEPHPAGGVCWGSCGMLLYWAGPEKKSCF